MTSRLAAVVLAAGRGTRFQASGGTGPTKLVATVGGTPMIRHAVAAALDSHASPVIVVTGHARGAVEAALDGLPIHLAPNPNYADGLSSSLKAGVAAVPRDAEGVLVLLGDMPLVSAALIDRLIGEVQSAPEADAVVPVANGRRGNPVYLSRRLFRAVEQLEGDAGARHLLRDPAVLVREVATDDPSSAHDIDEVGDLDVQP